jgi:hypothetical protein
MMIIWNQALTWPVQSLHDKRSANEVTPFKKQTTMIQHNACHMDRKDMQVLLHAKPTAFNNLSLIYHSRCMIYL